MDEQAFQVALDQVLGSQSKGSGIGTLGEKTMHAVLKRYLEPLTMNHEISLGPYVADIVGENGVVEIQTAGFHLLRKKLEALLPEVPVTIVYPIPHHKWIVWIDTETGEASPKRKSPKTGSYYHAFYELYKIKQQLTHPNLRLHLMLIDVVDYRQLNGWSKDGKKGSSRYERLPLELVDEMRIDALQDYGQLVPSSLPPHFTSKDYAKCTKLRLKDAQTALNVLCYLGAVERVGKQGRLYLYRHQ